jgi:membrane protease YdiL (CAAX protease family)
MPVMTPRAPGWRPLAALLAAAVVGSGVLMVADGLLARTAFSWLPAWYLQPVGLADVTRYPTSAWVATLVAYMVLNGVAGPVTEELYFRGWLLPRMSRFGRWAPLANATLFSLYHFWAPWQNLSRILLVVPWAYTVWWKRNIYLGILMHCAIDVIGWSLTFGLILRATL